VGEVFCLYLGVRDMAKTGYWPGIARHACPDTLGSYPTLVADVARAGNAG